MDGVTTRRLRGITLGLVRDSVTAVIGPPGSGKSTLLDCVTGRLAPAGGRVTVHDRVVDARASTWHTLPAARPGRPELLVADDVRTPDPLHAARRHHPAEERTVLVTTARPDVAAAADVALVLRAGRLADAVSGLTAGELAAHLRRLAED